MSKKRRLSATEVARGFSEVVNRVHYNDETVVVERGGVAVCEIRPAYGVPRFTGADLASLLRSLPPPGRDWADAVERAKLEQPEAQHTRWRR